MNQALYAHMNNKRKMKKKNKKNKDCEEGALEDCVDSGVMESLVAVVF
jgi:hypothetical protein